VTIVDYMVFKLAAAASIFCLFAAGVFVHFGVTMFLARRKSTAPKNDRFTGKTIAWFVLVVTSIAASVMFACVATTRGYYINGDSPRGLLIVSAVATSVTMQGTAALLLFGVFIVIACAIMGYDEFIKLQTVRVKCRIYAGILLLTVVLSLWARCAALAACNAADTARDLIQARW